MTVYSPSGLSAFEGCPRKYWYAYIGKPEVEPMETVEAFLGSRVHEALEELYRWQQNGQVMDSTALVACYEDAWKRQWSAAVRISRKEYSAGDYLEVGRESLRKYHARYRPFDQSRTLRLEEEISADLRGDGRYRIRGFIDRLSRRPDGTYEIHDYKTSSRLPTQAEADADRQLALYQIGVEGMWDDVEGVDLIWHYVRFDREVRSRRSPEQIDAVKRDCIGVIDDIESRGREEENFPTNRSGLCDWCEYQGICPATPA